jgi:hypothetical protein
MSARDLLRGVPQRNVGETRVFYGFSAGLRRTLIHN